MASARALEVSKPCTRSRVEAQGNEGRAEVEKFLESPSFLMLINDSQNDSTFARLPVMFMDVHADKIGESVTLKGPSGWVGQVNLSYDRGWGFQEGWKEFSTHHGIEAGDYVIFALVTDSNFSVKIYNNLGCEKALQQSAANVETSTAAADKGGEFVSGFVSPRFLGDRGAVKLGGKRKTQNEVETLSGIGKKLCIQQLNMETCGTENGNAEIEMEGDRIKASEKLEKAQSKLDPDIVHECSEELENEISTPVQEGHKSEECSSSESEKKSVEAEEVDKFTRARRKRVHRAVYETEMKRFMAMEAAQAYETANPSTMLVVNKTAITKSQSYFSSVFARKWFPEEKSQLLLIDDADNKWPVTFIPTASHMVLGAGWAKFVRNNKLEKGDVVVFELKNPNTLTLVVHIFRVKDYTFLKVSDAGNTNSVSTPSRSETPTGTTMANTSAGTIKDESPTGITDFSGLKVPQTPMLPQYAAVAKYFANRGTPVVETRRKVGNGATGEAELQKSSEGMNRNEGSGPTLHQADTLASPQQGGLSSISAPQERDAKSSETVDHKPLSVPQQAPQQEGTFVPAELGANKNFFPPGMAPQQPVQFVLAQQGQIPYVMPPQLGGGFVIASQGQVPYVMPLQDGASFVKLQHMGPPQAPHQEDDPHGVPVPPGLPKEVEFPKPVKEETPVRPRERWEIKPRRPRPPTDAERQRAMDKAIEFWTPNPHVMVALKPSQVYAGFSLTLRCAALPDETRDATLVDCTGQTWMCKWLVNHSGRRLSAGWKRFAVDHLLEEGDVCVFEMIDRVKLTLLIHIFRIKLDDHTMEPIEVKKSEGGRSLVDPARRKRKSRAKPKGLGPPLPKLPAYSGCRMEKLGGSSSPPTGANILPNMPSYKYTALQSQRRPVTMEERRRAELAARNLNTKNPSVTVVMRNSSVYCHFLVSIPSAFAKQWLPRKLVRVTLLDSGGQKSTARWAGNRKKSACLKSFREFSLSHCLEEGDALVFELMDPNQNNPVFLVHVFRVVELPNTRISPKDWENHYKLDVMIGTMKAVPLQAFQRRYDGEARLMHAYQRSSVSGDENDEPPQAPRPPPTLAQLSPKSKTKAIYSAIVRRKTKSNGDSAQIDLGEGTSRRHDNTAHTTQGHSELFADKATHISQLERLGRQQIARDLVPLLNKTMPKTDGTMNKPEVPTRSATTYTEHVSDKAGADGISNGSHTENGWTTQVVQNGVQTVTRIPKVEPVENVSPPKERTRVRRKTTKRREAGQDEFLPITLGDARNWEGENSAHSKEDNPGPNDSFHYNTGGERCSNPCQDDNSLCRESGGLVRRMPKSEPLAEDVQGVRPSLGTHPRDSEISAMDRQIISPPNVPNFNRPGIESGLQWLQVPQTTEHIARRHPKEEPSGEHNALGEAFTSRNKVNHHPESGHVDVVGQDRGEASTVDMDSRTHFRHVFFGSVFDKVGSEVGAHVPNLEKRRLQFPVGLTSEAGNRWQFPEAESASPVDKKGQLGTELPWRINQPDLRHNLLPASQVQGEAQGDGRHEVIGGKAPSEADLYSTHVYMSGF